MPMPDSVNTKVVASSAADTGVRSRNEGSEGYNVASPTAESSASEGKSMKTAVEANFEDPAVARVRLNWQIKAVLPIVFVLVNGLLLFTLATVSWQDPQRHLVLVVAGTGAIAICAALLL